MTFILILKLILGVYILQSTHPGVFPLVGHGYDILVKEMNGPVSVSSLQSLLGRLWLVSVSFKPVLYHVVIELFRPQHASIGLASHQALLLSLVNNHLYKPAETKIVSKSIQDINKLFTKLLYHRAISSIKTDTDKVHIDNSKYQYCSFIYINSCWFA